MSLNSELLQHHEIVMESIKGSIEMESNASKTIIDLYSNFLFNKASLVFVNHLLLDSENNKPLYDKHLLWLENEFLSFSSLEGTTVHSQQTETLINCLDTFFKKQALHALMPFSIH